MTRYLLGFLFIAGMAWGQGLSIPPGQSIFVSAPTPAEHYRREARKEYLFTEMQHRILTKREEEEALAYGDELNLHEGVAYNEHEKREELAAAWAMHTHLLVHKIADDREPKALNSEPKPAQKAYDDGINRYVKGNPGCPTGFICEPYRTPEQAENWARQRHDDGILKPAPGNLVGGQGKLSSPQYAPIAGYVCAADFNCDVPDNHLLVRIQPTALDKARLEVMQKALDYIAKMAARNPHEEQDAGEFLEKMGRILAGSEGK